MANKTEQKIMDAALKVFSQNGYKGATTRIIADESGFNELTLFRRFETKKNLFNRVLLKYTEKLKKDFASTFENNKFETPEDFLKQLIMDIDKIQHDNFQLIHLLEKEQCRESKSLKEELVYYLEGYIKKNIKNDKINYKALGITIFSLVYTLNLSKYNGDTFIDQEGILEGFINNTIMCIDGQ
jgi:AcrR family transcriptional regulator